jgi:hypothetical protein
MPRDRRRGRRSHSRGAARSGPVGQQPAQPAAPSRPISTARVAPVAKAPAAVKQPLLANPHLGKDLRNIGIVTVVLVILLIVLSIVL